MRKTRRMLEARKGGPLGWLWAKYVDGKVRRSFRAVWLRGELPPLDRGLLVYANHSSFWDGFALHALSRAAGWDGSCIMEEQNLRRWPFLARIGAFSVRRGDARSAAETLRYARRLLERPGAAVGIFPEGVLRTGEPPPLRLERGVELLARMSGARCVPLAIRCAFFEHERPDLLLELGPPHEAGPLERFASELDARVGSIQTARTTEGFRVLVRGAKGIAERTARGHAPT